MWIVKLALNRPYTFVVMSLLILIMGVLSIRKTPTDIFPVIDIPVVSVIWSYQGLSTEEMERRITTYSEYSLYTVNEVKNIESQTLSGVSVIKIYFHPEVKIEAAVAQVTAISQAILKRMPPGVQPPIILRFNASSVPILQLSLSSKSMNEAQLYDYGIYRMRQQLAVVQGSMLPAPYGGKPRQIMVDIDPEALLAKGLTPNDVAQAINAQNLMLPAGTAKIGAQEYSVGINSSTDAVAALNDLPIKQINGSMIYIRDVANVRDGFSEQTNIVRKDGNRSVLLSILKNGNASTLDIVDRVKNEVLPKSRAAAPQGLEIKELFDQSVFVRAAINGVVHEGLIAALLTATMILLFLGSWRSTLIVVISIPLSILTSIIGLSALGYSLNVMTLGGLALAIGILVDDATVEIENIHRNMAMGKPLKTAILDGAMQIATPTFVATLTICIVFVSVLFLTGPAKYLFTPLALAVVFAMTASYMLSRTLVPVLVNFLLANEEHHTESNNTNKQHSLFMRLHLQFNNLFDHFKLSYTGLLRWALLNHKRVLAGFIIMIISAGILLPFVGRDFFPQVDTGQFRLHVRVPSGTRIEETEKYFSQVEAEIRNVIPAQELDLVLDNIGVVSEGFNLAFGDSATTGTADGEILVSLKHDHQPTGEYIKRVRQHLNERFPQLTFFFQPADIVSQILNFGLPAPIDIQVIGYNRSENYKIAQQIAARVKTVPGAVDVHIHQVVDLPKMQLNFDRTRVAELGQTQRDIANNILVSLSTSFQVAPNYWVDPKNGIPYPVAVQTPKHRINSIADLENTPVAVSGNQTQLLSNLATISREKTVEVANHANVQPVFDIYTNVQDRDLGAVAGDIDQIVNEFRAKLPVGSTIVVRGQVDSMQSAFFSLGTGLILAALLVYLLMVVNFQSWSDPFIIIMALPGAFTGIVWMLFVTQTTFNVPSLMGAIMSIGVATANSILLVTFANEQMEKGSSALQAALLAGQTRLRPIIMTALAMIIGMLPMSLGLGEGGEQNAPLGRAVIGGLLLATFATLLLVPVIFSLIRGKQKAVNSQK